MLLRVSGVRVQISMREYCLTNSENDILHKCKQVVNNCAKKSFSDAVIWFLTEFYQNSPSSDFTFSRSDGSTAFHSEELKYTDIIKQ